MASRVLRHEAEIQDDDISPTEQHSYSTGRKRSTRACDQCRKTKSKCERSDTEGEPCQNCAASGASCLFLGPSHKRGPPKGYIHVIERRLQQVEAVLGAIMGSPDPRAQSLVADLSKDSLAGDILRRVKSGPFGATADLDHSFSSTKEDMLTSIIRTGNENDLGDPGPLSARNRRQSRLSREEMSSGNDILVSPTSSWQENLREQLSSSAMALDNTTQTSTQAFTHRPREFTEFVEGTSSSPVNWDGLYTIERNEEDEAEDEGDVSVVLGQLSLDQNSRIRYHNNASALWLLSSNNRVDNRNQGVSRQDNVTSGSSNTPEFSDRPHHIVPIKLPPVDVQERLIEFYFTHVHPVFPVLHKQQFLESFQDRVQRNDLQTAESISHLTAHAPDLVLSAVFAVSARYASSLTAAGKTGKDRTDDYQINPERILYEVYHQSSLPTCQALLLLAYRDLGLGSWDQGWIHIGMAIRMAQDLGIDRDEDTWKRFGVDAFSSLEKEARKQLWHACSFADRFVSVFMGRSVTVREPKPDPTHLDENQPEEYAPLHIPSCKSTAVAETETVFPHTISCFNASAALSHIVGEVVEKLYTVRLPNRRAEAAALARQLNQWLVTLPGHFKYESGKEGVIPPPNVMELHCQYWWAVILVHRSFLPPKFWSTDGRDRHEPVMSDIQARALDQCVAAATRLGTVVASYDENYYLQSGSVFFIDYVLNAGLIHALVVQLEPDNVRASMACEKCRVALKELETVWPAAKYAGQVLCATTNLSKRTPLLRLPINSRNPHKRTVEDAFGDKAFDDRMAQEGEYSGASERVPNHDRVMSQESGMMASMLGIDLPSRSTASLWSWTNLDEPSPPSTESPASPASSRGLTTHNLHSGSSSSRPREQPTHVRDGRSHGNWYGSGDNERLRR